ncbi:hypothetical protein [Clostridium cellulovorans]|uniref:Uncharacterized protein n=1 Tax=Clostridium cellulovorans (strain ATCC 35296 / DSM 3052 / OCM 3 / 743B) TaxID=573061 RepID=D9SKC3_CLOC7|nr:hypothetical protein [Clostridium cellulovorans]ADL51419.1 hypothetical protein Clocel_1675 [Clostridium cellulovorans 743B]
MKKALFPIIIPMIIVITIGLYLLGFAYILTKANCLAVRSVFVFLAGGIIAFLYLIIRKLIDSLQVVDEKDDDET